MEIYFTECGTDRSKGNYEKYLKHITLFIYYYYLRLFYFLKYAQGRHNTVF